MGKQDGVEYPMLEGKGHKDDCRVYNGIDWINACNCGVDETPAFRKLDNYSNYEIREDLMVRNLKTGKFLSSNNERGTVQLLGDDGVRKSYSVWDLKKWAFQEAE